MRADRFRALTRRWAARLRRNVYDHRVLYVSLLAIVSMGLAWGSLRDRAAARERARIAAPELTAQDFERHLADEARPPRDVYSSTAGALAVVAVYFLVYETLRALLLAGLAKLVGRPTRGDPARPRASGGWRSIRPEAIGKCVFVAGLSLLWVYTQGRDSLEESDDPRAAIEESSGVESGAGREDAEREAMTPRSHRVGGVVFSAALVGTYELAGVTAAAAAALATGGTISTGAHYLLGNLGFLLCAAAGGFGLYSVASRLADAWLGEVPGWLWLPVFVGVFFILHGAERFFEAVPVPCSKCGAKAYQTSARPPAYRCSECGHRM